MMPYTASKRGPGRPPAAKSADTREGILRAARGVFSDLGYDAATFQAIAVRANLTRPAINHYFASKRVLWREVIEQANATIVSAGIARAHEQTGLIDRLSAFLAITTQAEEEDRSAAAFLVTSVLEAQRHPELSSDGHDLLKTSREFFTWAVSDAITSGELSTDTHVSDLVEMLVAVVWGVGFYAGFVGNAEERLAVVSMLERMLANTLS